MKRSVKNNRRQQQTADHDEDISDFMAIDDAKAAQQKDNMVYLKKALEPVQSYYNQAKSLIDRCTKPDLKEYKKIVTATSIGFLVMGFIGYFVKLVHIPINNLIVN